MGYTPLITGKAAGPIPAPAPGTPVRFTAWQSLRHFFKNDAQKIRHSSLRVYLILLSFNTDGVSDAGYSQIMQITGLSKRSVSRAFDELKSRRLIVQIKRGTKGKGTSLWRIRQFNGAKK